MIHFALLPEVIEKLSGHFRKNGYIRWMDPKRRRTEARRYKKGHEVRLVADSFLELRAIRRLLRAVDIEPGKPFMKANQWRQPIYGTEKVRRFLELIGEPVEPSK